MKERIHFATWKNAAAVMFLMAAALLACRPASAAMPLRYWPFDDANWLSDGGFPPIAFTNVVNVPLGDGNSLQVDDNYPAFINYNVTEADGTTNLTVDQGTLMMWFSPSWSGTNAGGTGPGVWGRLIEAGAYTTNASYGWWSLYVDPEGTNIFFGAQTNNGSGASYLSAPINWTNDTWHFIALTYSPTGSVLYLDDVLATNGAGVTYFPGPDVLTNGFYLGSDSNGVAQAHGLVDDLATYDGPLSASSIASMYNMYSFVYYDGNSQTAAYGLFAQGPVNPPPVPTLSAITGSGWLQSLGASGSCVTSSNVWLTNVVATLAGNGTENLTFSIAGGSSGLMYDVFANSVLWSAYGTNVAWSWMGQGTNCASYMVTNLPPATVFVILGTPQDLDADGLTDAFEKLVTATNPYVPDTPGDGLSDLYKLLHGIPLEAVPPVPSLNSISLPVCAVP